MAGLFVVDECALNCIGDLWHALVEFEFRIAGFALIARQFCRAAARV
jgi:hypothetical protein